MHIVGESGWASSALLEDAARRGVQPRYLQLLIQRFGLNGQLPASYTELGKRFGISASRCSQIVNKTLTDLGHPARKRLWFEMWVSEHEHDQRLFAAIRSAGVLRERRRRIKDVDPECFRRKWGW